MTSEQLQRWLAGLQGEARLRAVDFDDEASLQVKRRLEESFSGGELHVQEVEVDVEALALRGWCDLRGELEAPDPAYERLEAWVSFMAEEEQVRGVFVILAFPEGRARFRTRRVDCDLGFLEGFALEEPNVVLAAGPVDEVWGLWTGFGGERPLPLRGRTASAYLSAMLPEPVEGSLRRVHLGAELEGVTLGALSELVLVEGLELEVPAAIEQHLGDALRLDGLDLGLVDLGPGGHRLDEVSVTLGFGRTWPIVPDKLALRDLGLTFHARTSGDWRAEFSATLSVLETDLIGFCSLPDLSFEASLSPETPLQLAPLLREWLPGIAAIGELNHLNITHLELQLGLGDSSWGFFLRLDSGWTLPISERLSLGLKDLELHAGGGSSGAFGRVAASVEVAGVVLEAELSRNDQGDTGWTLQAGVQADSVVPIGQLALWLSQQVGVSLPDAVAGVELTRLGMALRTGEGSFTLGVGGRVPLRPDVALRAELDLALTWRDGYTLVLEGWLDVAGHRFTLDVNASSEFGGRMVVTWVTRGALFDVQDLVRLLGVQDVQVPANLNLGLSSVAFALNTQDKSVALGARWAGAAADVRVFFATAAGRSGRAYVFGVGVGQVKLERLPVLGTLGGEALLVLDDLALVLASADLDDFTPPKRPDPPAQGGVLTVVDAGASMKVSRGLTLTTTLKVGALLELDLSLPLYRPRGDARAAEAAEDTDDGTRWVQLGASLGPLRLERLGVRFSAEGNESRVTLLLDAGISLKGFTLRFLGLSLTVDPKRPLRLPTPGLQGLQVAYAQPGALELRGGLLIHRGEYVGELVVRVAGTGFAGFGAIKPATEEEPFSAFAYMVLGVPIGDPRFRLNAVAGGFGVNRRARIPTVQVKELEDFPLVSVARGGDPADLRTMSDDFPVSPGNVWLAVGLEFASFEVVTGFLLGVASVGTHLELTLIGMPRVQLPPKTPNPPISLEMVAAASVNVTEGRLSLAGTLTSSSYILVKEAKLSGGFALVTWLGQGGGDFVFSAGGYHPQLEVPAHYPRLDPVGIDWKIGDALTIKGTQYLALTSSAVMLGGVRQATVKVGGFEASFRLQFDALVAWMPFRYAGDIALSVKVSYTAGAPINKTVSLNLGATLALSGPAFKGVAELHLVIASFRIEFGEETPVDSRVTWADFRERFLATAAPQASAHGRSPVCGASVRRGLAGELEGGWRLTPGALDLVTSTGIPAKRLALNGQALEAGAGGFGLGMVGDDEARGVAPERLDTLHAVSLLDQAGTPVPLPEGARAEAVLGPVPKALWSHEAPKHADAMGEASQLPGACTGLRLRAPVGGGEGLALKLAPPSTPRTLPRPPALPPTRALPGEPLEVLERSVADAEVAERRAGLMRALSRPDWPLDPAAVRVEALAEGRHALLAAPHLCTWELA
ncbi:MAG: hypothetical protein H6741_27475 [Alphaproteobacteria bacterium]|nr:hypothetical protein [Alphaproteobacteria bacterium]MCB9796454.1 hypothetical protein [Alphaproteobacteria bacterium]